MGRKRKRRKRQTVVIGESLVALLTRPTVHLTPKEGSTCVAKDENERGRTVTALTAHSFCNLGISLCAVGCELVTPVRILIVRGTSPRTFDIPTSDLPSFPV
jgi:hypothetical protein